MLMFGALSAAAARLSSAGKAVPLQTAVDKAVGDSIAAGGSPGVQIAIAGKSGVLLSRGYGLADIGAKSAVGAQSVFRIGSLTKQFTAAAILRLAQDGKLKLDAPVARFLPAFGKLKPATLLQLMHHTAGLHSDESDAPPAPSTNGMRTQVTLAAEIAEQKAPFDFDPGTAWLYSNANYIVLGAVVEVVTGLPFTQAITNLISRPLGLDRTAVDVSGDPVAGRVEGYSPVEGKPGVFEKAAYIEISDAGGAGAMRSTALDLCRWHAALLSNKLLDKAHLKIMLTPGTLNDGRVSGANRFSAGDAHYGDTQYACGLLISPPGEKNRNILHYGAINGFAAVLQTWLDAGITMAVLTNGDIGPSAPFRAVRQAVAAQTL